MKLLRNASTVSFFTALSRVLGLFREILMATFFGTSLVKSAFDLAFRIPNLFRAIFGEGSLHAAFIPVYNTTREREGTASANLLAGKVLTVLAVTLTSMTALAVIGIHLARPWLTYGGRAETVLRLLAILLPYLIFLCLAAACMGILNSIGQFALPAATPMLMNIVWIATLLFIIPRLDDSLDLRIAVLAWAVVFSGALQLACQAAPLVRAAIRPVLSFQWNDSRLKQVFQAFVPAAITAGFRDINTLIDGVLALWIGAWAPAALVFAERIAYLPLGLFSTAFATVLLPTLSRQYAKDAHAMSGTLTQAIQGLLAVIFPAAAALTLLAMPIVRLIYEHGAFDADSTLLTSRALMAYAPGLIVFSLLKMIVTAFNACKDTRTPMRYGGMAVACNFLLNITLILTLPAGWKHAGLAIATVLSAAASCLLLAIILHRRVGIPDWKGIGSFTLRIGLCTLIMLAALALLPQIPSTHIPWDQTTKTGQVMQMICLVAIGLFTYALALLLICRHGIRALLAAHKDQS
jgi:putative peptidoglycan lipid II flippase